MAIDWQLMGTAIGGLVVGAGGFFAGRSGRQVTEAANGAESAVITMMREEVARLSTRVSALEAREGRMIRHIYRLEAMLRELGKEPPTFDLESDSIKAGGTD